MTPYHLLRHLILKLAQMFSLFCQRMLKRLSRFFQFFTYLNWQTLWEVCDRALKSRLHGLSAEMAYNAILSLFPGVLALISAIALFDELQSTFTQITNLLSIVIPNEVRSLVKENINQIIITRNPQIFSLSFLGAIWAFSGALNASMSALDQIHQIPPKQRRTFLGAKLVAIGLSLGSIFLLILACIIVFVSDVIVQIIARQSCLIESLKHCQLSQAKNCLIPLPNCLLESQLLDIWDHWRWPIALGIVSLNFAFIYRYGPSRHYPGIPILPGAIIAAILWAFLSALFRLYVSHFGHYNWTYGTIGTFIILLLWLYLSSLVMLIGAQLNVTVGNAMTEKLSFRR